MATHYSTMPMMKTARPIYLDHNATTPVRAEVVEAVTRCLGEGYANPASQHQPGQRARRALESAREEVAAILGADPRGTPPDRVVFTAGGTEANNLAVLGFCPPEDPTPGGLLISSIEHQSVLEPAEYLMERGWRLDTLPVDAGGVVRREMLDDPATKLLGQGTRLVSVLLANHETGVVQPVEELAERCRAAGVPIHTDAVQAVGKMPVHFRRLGVDAMTVSAHKFNGPTGVGALVLDGRIVRRLRMRMFGGRQQYRRRPGTESIPLAVGMATALRLWRDEATETARRMTALRERFESGLREAWPEVIIHGQSAPRLPGTCNAGFPPLDGQEFLLALDAAGVACSIGSACSSGAAELSPTLRAMGLPSETVRASIRFSLGATTTEEDVEEALRRIAVVLERMRGC
jgi:cysteine desulfurase